MFSFSIFILWNMYPPFVFVIYYYAHTKYFIIRPSNKIWEFCKHNKSIIHILLKNVIIQLVLPAQLLLLRCLARFYLKVILIWYSRASLKWNICTRIIINQALVIYGRLTLKCTWLTLFHEKNPNHYLNIRLYNK